MSLEKSVDDLAVMTRSLINCMSSLENAITTAFPVASKSDELHTSQEDLPEADPIPDSTPDAPVKSDVEITPAMLKDKFEEMREAFGIEARRMLAAYTGTGGVSQVRKKADVARIYAWIQEQLDAQPAVPTGGLPPLEEETSSFPPFEGEQGFPSLPADLSPKDKYIAEIKGYLGGEATANYTHAALQHNNLTIEDIETRLDEAQLEQWAGGLRRALESQGLTAGSTVQ